MDSRMKMIDEACAYLRRILEEKNLHPKAGIILGSGLGKLADRIGNPVTIPYREIPGFPQSTAIGHAGVMYIGSLGGKDVIAMKGRFHFYEGYSMDLVTLPVRVMARLGAEYLFVSNAAGALNPHYHVGELVMIKDQINLIPNPLIGPNMDDFGPRFPDMTCPFDRELQKKASEIGSQMGLTLRKGVYTGVTGPTYETPAEVRFYRKIGGDLVGMSSAPEVIAGRHSGMKVFGMSCVTNISNTRNTIRKKNDGQDVVEQADKAAIRMSELFARLIASI